MDSERIDETHHGDDPPLFSMVWRASLLLGLITLVLGVIVVARPTQSLAVIAILLGVAMIASGAFQLARAIAVREGERMWRGISGILFVLAGLALIRHLDLSVALIGLFIGFTWVIQGIAMLVESFSRRGRDRAENGWSVLFGAISLIAGIVVISSPIASVAALTLFMGVWLIIMGLMEMTGALLGRRAVRKLERESGRVNVPGQRATETETGAEKRAGHASHE